MIPVRVFLGGAGGGQGSRNNSSNDESNPRGFLLTVLTTPPRCGTPAPINKLDRVNGNLVRSPLKSSGSWASKGGREGRDVFIGDLLLYVGG